MSSDGDTGPIFSLSGPVSEIQAVTDGGVARSELHVTV